MAWTDNVIHAHALGVIDSPMAAFKAHRESGGKMDRPEFYRKHKAAKGWHALVGGKEKRAKANAAKIAATTSNGPREDEQQGKSTAKTVFKKQIGKGIIDAHRAAYTHMNEAPAGTRATVVALGGGTEDYEKNAEGKWTEDSKQAGNFTTGALVQKLHHGDGRGQIHVHKSIANDLYKSGGPYIGPKGGKWLDPMHTIHWDPAKHGSKVKHAHELGHVKSPTKAHNEHVASGGTLTKPQFYHKHKAAKAAHGNDSSKPHGDGGLAHGSPKAAVAVAVGSQDVTITREVLVKMRTPADASAAGLDVHHDMASMRALVGDAKTGQRLFLKMPYDPIAGKKYDYPMAVTKTADGMWTATEGTKPKFTASSLIMKIDQEEAQWIAADPADKSLAHGSPKAAVAVAHEASVTYPETTYKLDKFGTDAAIFHANKTAKAHLEALPVGAVVKVYGGKFKGAYDKETLTKVGVGEDGNSVWEGGSVKQSSGIVNQLRYDAMVEIPEASTGVAKPAFVPMLPYHTSMMKEWETGNKTPLVTEAFANLVAAGKPGGNPAPSGGGVKHAHELGHIKSPTEAHNLHVASGGTKTKTQFYHPHKAAKAAHGGGAPAPAGKAKLVVAAKPKKAKATKSPLAMDTTEHRAHLAKLNTVSEHQTHLGALKAEQQTRKIAQSLALTAVDTAKTAYDQVRPKTSYNHKHQVVQSIGGFSEKAKANVKAKKSAWNKAKRDGKKVSEAAYLTMQAIHDTQESMAKMKATEAAKPSVPDVVGMFSEPMAKKPAPSGHPSGKSLDQRHDAHAKHVSELRSKFKDLESDNGPNEHEFNTWQAKQGTEENHGYDSWQHEDAMFAHEAAMQAKGDHVDATHAAEQAWKTARVFQARVGKSNEGPLPLKKGIAMNDLANDIHKSGTKKGISMNDLASQIAALDDLRKGGGPYIGPKGGKWADPMHKVAWHEGGASKKGRSKMISTAAAHHNQTGQKLHELKQSLSKPAKGKVDWGDVGDMASTSIQLHEARRQTDSSNNEVEYPNPEKRVQEGAAGRHESHRKLALASVTALQDKANSNHASHSADLDHGSKAGEISGLHSDVKELHDQHFGLGEYKKGVFNNDLVKGGGPYVGPRGGLYADPDHKTSWGPKDKGGKKTHSMYVDESDGKWSAHASPRHHHALGTGGSEGHASQESAVAAAKEMAGKLQAKTDTAHAQAKNAPDGSVVHLRNVRGGRVSEQYQKAGGKWKQVGRHRTPAEDDHSDDVVTALGHHGDARLQHPDGTTHMRPETRVGVSADKAEDVLESAKWRTQQLQKDAPKDHMGMVDNLASSLDAADAHHKAGNHDKAHAENATAASRAAILHDHLKARGDNASAGKAQQVLWNLQEHKKHAATAAGIEKSLAGDNMAFSNNLAVLDGIANDLRKGGGPYIGPKGGKWADPMHKIAWNPSKHTASETQGPHELGHLNAHQAYQNHKSSGGKMGVADFHKRHESAVTAHDAAVEHKKVSEAMGSVPKHGIVHSYLSQSLKDLANENAAEHGSAKEAPMSDKPAGGAGAAGGDAAKKKTMTAEDAKAYKHHMEQHQKHATSYGGGFAGGADRKAKADHHYAEAQKIRDAHSHLKTITDFGNAVDKASGGGGGACVASQTSRQTSRQASREDEAWTTRDQAQRAAPREPGPHCKPDARPQRSRPERRAAFEARVLPQAQGGEGGAWRRRCIVVSCRINTSKEPASRAPNERS